MFIIRNLKTSTQTAKAIAIPIGETQSTRYGRNHQQPVARARYKLIHQFVGKTGYYGYLNAMEVIATTPAGTIGDYNNNGKVDAADYTVWRNNWAEDGARESINRDVTGNVQQQTITSSGKRISVCRAWQRRVRRRVGARADEDTCLSMASVGAACMIRHHHWRATRRGIQPRPSSTERRTATRLLKIEKQFEIGNGTEEARQTPERGSRNPEHRIGDRPLRMRSRSR